MNISKIVSKLKKEYKKDLSMLGSFSSQGKNDFFILIATVLSARAKDETTWPLAEEIFKKYNKPKDFASMPLKKIEKLVYKSGFYKQKAKRVKEISKKIISDHKGKVPKTMEELTALPGVGKKTAGCVMVYAHGKYEIPIDIHCQVISQRLGWTKEKTPDMINDDLKKKIPRKYWMDINELLVMHGKRICETRMPYCSKCVLFDLCPRVGVKKSK